MKSNYDALVIGCGPAGMGAALALKKAGVDFAIIEKDAPGGKVNIAPRVDNYPRQAPIPGPDLAVLLFQRIIDNNIEMIQDEVLSLTKEGELFHLKTKFSGELTAKVVLIATGTKERKLGLEHEDEMLGHGLSYCAVCDGHFFKDKDVLVVGGGNVALKETVYLSKLCKKVYLVHRRNEFRGDLKYVNEVKELPNVEIITPYIPLEIICDDKVKAIRLQNREDNSERIIEVQGFFPLVGQDPNSNFVNIENVKNEWGTIPYTSIKTMETGCPNLFVAGDVTPRDLRQIYLAEHDGMVAANSMIEALKK